MNGAFAVSCFLVMWTRIDCDSIANASFFTSGTFSPGKSPEENAIRGDSNVRNFFPMKGKHKWMRREFPTLTEMLLFNVSSIGDDEEVTLAQLHLHRRRQMKTRFNYSKRFLPTPYRVLLYQVQSDGRRRAVPEDARTMKLASIPVSQAVKPGWHTLDVTPVVRELLINAQGPVELLFGVRFEAPKGLGKSLSSFVPAKHFLKNPNVYTSDHPYRTSSYLVVHSQADPYFDFDSDDDNYQSIENVAPATTPTPTTTKERHLKHKISMGNDAEEPDTKMTGKYESRMENEVFKSKIKGSVRHGHGSVGTKKKRSKADEIALEEKTMLKSLPFLHANEVEEIRQTSRRLTRSSEVHRKNKRKTGNTDFITTVKIREAAEKR